jgi:phosphoadenosine phosphosulfate reductase
MDVDCWVTGLRCTEGRTRTDFLEREERQYLALQGIAVNPLYSQGYRSLGCTPCTSIRTGPDERAGRWVGTSKCGGECGIHTQPLKIAKGA